MAMDSVYHAPTFEPTVDELSMLKRLEMGELVSMTAALREHLSIRLLEWGMIGKTFDAPLARLSEGNATTRSASNTSC